MSKIGKNHISIFIFSYEFINTCVYLIWYIGCLYEPFRLQVEGKNSFSVVMFLLEGVFPKNICFYLKEKKNKKHVSWLKIAVIVCDIKHRFLSVLFS